MTSRAVGGALVRLLLSLLLLAVPASAGTVVQETVTTTPSAALPVTLAAPNGGTTIGTGSTSATTTRSGLPTLGGTVNVLTLQHGTTTWTADIRFSSASGFGVAETLTVTLGSTVQVVLLGNTATQAVGSPVTLSSAGPDLTVIASGANLPGGSGTLAMSIEFYASGISTPLFVYSYTLTVT